MSAAARFRLARFGHEPQAVASCALAAVHRLRGGCCLAAERSARYQHSLAPGRSAGAGLRRRAATGNHDFDRLCADLGIEHRLAPPMRPQTNGMVERFNGRIEDILQSHRFRSGEDLEQTILRYVRLYNGQLPQSVLKGRTPIRALKDWHHERPELFRKQPYNHAGCDN